MGLPKTSTILKKMDGKVVQQERVFDYLYDPVYTVSSAVDHNRANVKAYVSKGQVRKVPEFASMFSNLPHHPRYTVQLDLTDPVPVSVDRSWRGHTEQRREALQLLAGVFPNAFPQLKIEECEVSGADRWKFFKRPLASFGQEFTPQFGFPQEEFESSVGKKAECIPTHCTVGVQTDYRENETQTDPYSPEYVVRPGTSPAELLTLASLTWGFGLPAGLSEVEMIERARAKRAWEATLPPLHDISQLAKTRRMMEEMEAKEWAFREEEIQKLQEARLAVLMDLKRQRAEAHKSITYERLNRMYSKKLEDKERKLHKINTDYMRSLRKLEAKRRNVEGKLERRGIFKNFTEFPFPTSVPSARNIYLDTYEGLEELESGLQASDLNKHVKSHEHKGKTMRDVIKPAESREIGLMKLYKALRDMGKEQEKPLRFLLKKEKPVPRPATPKVEEPTEGDEEIELAVIHLQKLLRGRSMQYEMVVGKENNLELIKELRTVHALQKEEQDLLKADKDLILALKQRRDEQREKITQEEAAHAKRVGAELEHLFNTLSKELIRLQEERRIHAFTLLAERDRLKREAEESGRRQLEERRRREEDDIFRQMVQVHQETVDLYLEDIILETLEQTADQQARDEIHVIAKKVNDIAYAMEESRNNLQSEEIVSELVYSFLIPEVEKITVRQRVRQRQHRHLQAARSIVQGTAVRPASLPSTLYSQFTCPGETASGQILYEMLSQGPRDRGEQH